MENDNERTMTGPSRAQQLGLATRVDGFEAIVDAWALNFDLEKLAAGLAHVSISEKRIEQIVAFSRSVFLEGLHRGVLVTGPTLMGDAPFNTFEGLADTLLAPCFVVRDRDGFFSHPALPACDEDVRIDKLLSAFGLETKFVDLDSDPLSVDVKDRMYSAFNFLDWTPKTPDGQGWMLLQIQETENGVYALFARREVKPLHRSRGATKMPSSHRAGVA